MRKDSLSKKAYAAIKEQIMFGELEPGEWIREDNLQQKLGIGRASLHDAFTLLTRERLVNNHFRKGFQISSISPKRIQDIYEIRCVLEPIALENGTQNIDRGWILDTRTKFLKMGESTDLDKAQYVQLDHEFHCTLIASLGNAYLTDLIECCMDYLSMIWLYTVRDPRKLQASYMDYVHMIDALRQNDRKKAVRLMNEHLQLSHESLTKTLLKTSW